MLDAIARAAARLRLRSGDHRCRGSARSDIPKKICACCWRRWRRTAKNRSDRWATDTPLACLSDRPQPLFHYFKQLFAQVTNPAIDPIREELVMSLTSYIGTERNILEETPQHCHTLKLPHPILTNLRSGKTAPRELGRFSGDHAVQRFSRRADGEQELERALDGLCRRASLAIRDGYRLLILSDRGVDDEYAPIPSLLALTAVHNHLVRERTRTQVALIIESGEPREVMHFALLIGYGASAVNPYLAIETLEDIGAAGPSGRQSTFETALKNYKKSINKGLLKVFSKMGISTLQSYRGAQVFEAIGLNQSADRPILHRHGFANRRRRAGRAGARSADEARARLSAGHRIGNRARPGRRIINIASSGEYHLLNPLTVSKLQHAVRDRAVTRHFRNTPTLIDQQNRDLCTLRGLMELRHGAEAGADRRSGAGDAKSSSDSPPARCRSGRSARRRTRRWRSR